MITTDILRPMIQEIAAAFPSFAAWFTDLTELQQDGMRRSWVRQVATLEPSDVRFAVDQILDGKVPMPANYEYDRLGVLIKTWAAVEAARRIEKANADKLREQARPIGDTSHKAISERFGPARRCGRAWAMAVRDGDATQKENDEAMLIVHRYHRHGDCELVWPAKVTS